MAYKANRDQDLAHAFKEAMRSEWDDPVEEVERALAAMGQSSSMRDLGGGGDCYGGGEMFFLTQEAGANRAMIHLLVLLYTGTGGSASTNTATNGDNLDTLKYEPASETRKKQQDEVNVNQESKFVENWDRESFAEKKLLIQMMDVLKRFLHSEMTEGHSLDVNVWRSHTDGATKVPMYCTSFVGVVSSVLHGFLAFSNEQFGRHIGVIYPVLCDLVRVQSEEVRQLVREVLLMKVRCLLGGARKSK